MSLIHRRRYTHTSKFSSIAEWILCKILNFVFLNLSTLLISMFLDIKLCTFKIHTLMVIQQCTQFIKDGNLNGNFYKLGKLLKLCIDNFVWWDLVSLQTKTSNASVEIFTPHYGHLRKHFDSRTAFVSSFVPVLMAVSEMPQTLPKRLDRVSASTQVYAPNSTMQCIYPMYRVFIRALLLLSNVSYTWMQLNRFVFFDKQYQISINVKQILYLFIKIHNINSKKC